MGKFWPHKWLLLTAFIVISCEGAPETCVCPPHNYYLNTPCEPTPAYSNLNAVMEGYDPIIGNTLNFPDPGMKNRIFEPRTRDERGRVILNSFIDKFREDLHCETDFSGTTVSNYNEYRKESSSSLKFARSADASVGVSTELFSFKASAGGGRESDEEDIKIQNFFRETNGEMIVAKAECITHSISISSFEPPVFTTAFLAALGQLNAASKNPQLNTSRDVFVEFVRAYGTHFMRSSYLGAKMIFAKMFTSKAIDVKEKNERRKCVADSAHASVQGSYKVVEASANFSRSSGKCDNSSQNTGYFESNNILSEKVSSVGSLPSQDLDSWAETVKESPVPIQFTLEKISNMFKADWFDSIAPEEDNFNGTAMFAFFEELSAQYCPLLLGKECPGDKKGCGYNSLCKPDATCENDPTQITGYKCITDYGPVLIVGGFRVTDNKWHYPSSGEAIGTWTLPDLPYEMPGGTLSVVGSLVYACGGGRSQYEPTSACYVIDRAEGSSHVWRSTIPLPVKMVYHSAVTIKDHIWFVYRGVLHDLNTKRNQFHTYHLPMTVSFGHCAVSNSSHSFIIAAGSGEDEIWVNTKEYSPAAWRRVGSLRAGRKYVGCVWFEQEVFITGGYPARDDAVVFDTQTHSLRSAGTLVQGRRGHGMMVLDGRPAVVGGWDDSVTSSSIETYDHITGNWTTEQSRRLREAIGFFGLVQLHV